MCDVCMYMNPVLYCKCFVLKCDFTTVAGTENVEKKTNVDSVAVVVLFLFF